MRETHVLLEGVWERLVRAVEEGSKQQSKSLKGSKLRHTSTLTFSKTMHDATMSMNTQDEILVHRRLLLPLFPLPSVFSVSIPLSEAWLRKDDRIAINRDFYYSSDSYILTRYLLSRRLLISRLFVVRALWFFISAILPFHPWSRPKNFISKARIFCSHWRWWRAQMI